MSTVVKPESSWVQALLINIKRFLRVHWFIIFVVVSYFTLTAYYMGPSITHCTTTVFGYGDNTAGPIWKYWLPGADSQPPQGSLEHYTNYPWGESLYSPIGVSSLLQATTLWSFERVAGPVCGFNLVNVTGFVATALVMFGFVYWLVKRRWLAWLAGYIVSFAPYFQYKVGGHLSYGYAALLIGALWLFFKVIKERKKRDSVLLGLVTGASFYWDPYFTLLVTVLLLPAGLTWLVYAWLQIRRTKGRERTMLTALQKERLRRLLISLAIIVVLFLPLAAVRHFSSSQINTYLTQTRGDVLSDAMYCSILPTDYFLPADNNYYIGSIFHGLYIRIMNIRHGCNPSEYTVGLAYIVSSIVLVSTVVFAWEKINKRKLYNTVDANGNDLRFVYLALVVTFLSAAVLALPPRISFIHLPSWYLLGINSGWRILDRLFLDINIVITVLFVLALMFFAKLPIFTRPRVRIGAFLAIFLLVFLQYQPFPPLHGSFSSFNYKKDVPPIMYWLHDQKDIKTIAGYPMDKVGETDNIVRFITYQKIAQKKLLNSTVPGSPQEPIRFSIKDLTDPQTLPVLRGLGIDALEIHYLTPQQLQAVNGITVLNYYDGLTIFPERIAIAKINSGPTADYATVLKTGFPLNGEIMKSAIDIQYETSQHAVIVAQALQGKNNPSRDARMCFDVKTADPKDTDILTLEVGNKTVYGPLNITKDFQRVELTVKQGQEVKLVDKSGDNMRLNNIGCQP